jgi:hypothetical protein
MWFQRLSLVMSAAVLTACGESKPSSPSSAAARVTGVWLGTITQGAAVLAYRIELSASQGGLVGTTRTDVPGPEGYFVVHTVSATLANDVLTLSDGTVTSASIPAGVFICDKTASLTLSDRDRNLAGPWVAPGCIPGTVTLTKQ